MTGLLSIAYSDFSAIELWDKSKSTRLLFERNPLSSNALAAIIERGENGINKNKISFPRKDGTAILDSDFSGRLATNGWTKLPNGLILQWGEATGPSGYNSSETYETNFHIAFNECFQVVLSDKNARGTTPNGNFAVIGLSKTKFEIVGSPGLFVWYAIGK